MTNPPILCRKSPGALVGGLEPLHTQYTKIGPPSNTCGKQYNEPTYG